VKTSFSGKYLNNYGFGSNDGSVFQLPQCMNITNAREKAGMDNTCASTVEHVPRGWDNWQALVGNSCYYNYTLSNNGVKEKHGDDYSKDYLIDLVKNRSLSFIESQSSLSSPFFVTMSVPSAHEPADPAPQYASYGSGLKAPRTPNYNWVDKGSGRHWMVDQVNVEGKGFNETVESFVDLLYRRRLATLQSVDDLIEEVVDRLEELGELDNTYIIYTSDNGYHLGQFGVPIDKRQPYESDLRVPMFVRGPGIKKNVTIDNSYALNIDLAPTILDMSGLSQATISGLGFDGESLLPLLTTGSTGRSKSFLVEYNGENVDGCWAYLENDFALNHAFSLYDGINCGLRGPESFKTEPKWEGGETFSTIQDSSNNTYKCVREIGGDYDGDGDDGSGTEDFQYCEWESGEREAFDLIKDYWQMNNLVKDMTEEEIEEWHQKLVALRR
jgi:N-acetylglucosamine-6-sulfatase